MGEGRGTNLRRIGPSFGEGSDSTPGPPPLCLSEAYRRPFKVRLKWLLPSAEVRAVSPPSRGCVPCNLEACPRYGGIAVSDMDERVARIDSPPAWSYSLLPGPT